MKSIVIKYMSAAALLLAAASASAQTAHSTYFLEGNNQRHKLNPAFQAEHGFVTFPLLGNFNTTLNSNIGLGTVFYPRGNEMYTFMHPSISNQEAMGEFSSTNILEADFDMDLITVGFKKWGGTNTIGLSLRSQTGAYMPYEIFQFLKEGQTATEQTYDIDKVDVVSQNYVELALGHARNITERLSVGAKVKVLFGGLYAKASIDGMNIYMSDNQWRINGRSTLVGSKGINFVFDDEGKIDDLDLSGFGIAGTGLGLDLGAVFRINDAATVSLAVTDIGFISWNGCTVAENRNQEFTYDGFDNIGAEDNPDGSNDFDDAADEIEESLKGLVRFNDSTDQGQTTMLYTTIRAAGEYGILQNKISFGALCSVRLGAPKVWAECMVTANFRPCSWFNAAVNGSFSNVGHSMGAMLNFHPRRVNFFIGTDYILAKFSKQIVPVSAAKLNLTMGLSFNI